MSTIHYTRFPVTSPQTEKLPTCCQQWNLGNDTTQQTQRTFGRANLLRTCYGEAGVMDFGVLSRVHTGDYSRRIRRMSPKTATVAEFGDKL